MTANVPPGRIVLLSTSPRVALGLLSWQAWDTLRGADLVLAGDSGHPQIPYLEAAGVAVVAIAADAAPAEAAARLLDAATVGRTSVWLTEDEEFDEAVALALGSRLTSLMGAEAASAPELELLPGSYDLPGARLLDLVDVMNRLRSPGGCPWDAEQTHASLVKYLLEEVYETVETIEDGDPQIPGPGRDALREELGDVLLQVAFHSRIAEEHAEDPFSIDDVATGIVEKLIRRHPHVFASGDHEHGAGVEAPTAAYVEANWEVIKAEEKQRTSVVEGVPMTQPALALAAKLAARARKAGLVVSAEIPGGLSEGLPESEAVFGDLLLGYAVAAGEQGIDPEAAVRAAARRYRDRIVSAEVSTP
jgi:XTP/dITP diphosphohydrolase